LAGLLPALLLPSVLLTLENIPSCLDELIWVEGLPVEPHFIVYMRTGAASGTSEKADLVPMPYLLASLDEYFL
jgi:hypothetical protein